MPSVATEGPLSTLSTSANSSFDGPRKSNEKTLGGVFTYTDGTNVDTGFSDQRLEQFKNAKQNSSLHSLPNGTPNGSVNGTRDRAHSKTGSIQSIASGAARHRESTSRNPGASDALTKLSNVEHAPDDYLNGRPQTSERLADPEKRRSSTSTRGHGDNWPLNAATTSVLSDVSSSSLQPSSMLSPQSRPLGNFNRFSSQSGMSPGASQQDRNSGDVSKSMEMPRLSHRHTLQVPKAGSTYHGSRDFSFSGGPSEEALTATGRFSPSRDENTSHHRHRRASLGLVRRATRSMVSDSHLPDHPPPDEDALRWTEALKAKRASKRKQKDEEDEDRVIIGKKVDEGHVNWITAYNMLTGIRFTVSRTNAKIDRELTDADFAARHKFSFDITGNELTPSAKYDFKFKDYSPWVFRHLRAIFGLDPADYLMSLTSKYILSELGSPGKSGSFFYFSRDYKYIIKTIHHAEHKLLRNILRQYYDHVVEYPNTLISQFYGLHRVKIPYGRKIHFVVMNNLFPPHRDIHQMFDLKGSTIGRDFKEEDLEHNPRATLKDLNWLRRNLHLEFDDKVKQHFVDQMKRDVTLLQRLKIMDYSLLVGIHDLEKGNEENVREKTLRVFQPGGERGDSDLEGRMLTRTPSRLENQKKARELRLTLKKERPVPMGLVNAKMPDEIGSGDERRDRLFYSYDGGIRATHEDGRGGEEIYYLGIIDCLTHYGLVKRLEHFWKGLSAPKTQISPVPSHAYGERFVNFITGITMTKEEAARRQAIQDPDQDLDHGQLEGLTDVEIASVRAQRAGELHLHAQGLSSLPEPRSPQVEKTMSRAQKQADKTERGRRTSQEEDVPERTLGTQHDGAGGDLAHLPVVEEVGEANSTGGRSNASNSKQDINEPSRSSEKLGNGSGNSMANGGIRQVSSSTTNSEAPAQIDGELAGATANEKKQSGELAPGQPQSFFEAHLTEKVSMAQGEDPRRPPKLTLLPTTPLESPLETNGMNEKEEVVGERRKGTT